MNLILKKILLIIFLSITVTVGWSHVAENNFNKYINNSLLDIINNDKVLINKGILRKDFFDIIYLIMDQQYPSDFDLSDSITKLNLNVLKIGNTDLLTKKEKRLLKKGVLGLIFQGYIIDKNRITLRFTKQIISYKKNTEYKEFNYRKKMFFFERSSTYDFIYEYSCEKQEWIFIKTDFTGI